MLPTKLSTLFATFRSELVKVYLFPTRRDLKISESLVLSQMCTQPNKGASSLVTLQRDLSRSHKEASQYLSANVPQCSDDSSTL